MRFVALAAGLTLIAAPQDTTNVAALVSLASGWVARFEMGLSSVLFHEQYRQSATTEGVSMYATTRPFEPGAPRREGNRGQRITEANIFLLKPANASKFVVYRDVYEVWSNPLTDHTDRLRALLEEGTASAIEQAKKLTDASARLNVGEITRNINIPTIAHEFLKPENLRNLRVRAAGTQVVDGRTLTVIEFQEIGRPTLVRGDHDMDLPAAGRYWIDPASGAVPRALVEFTLGRYTGRLEVELAIDQELKVWVPVKMLEVWHAGSRRVNGLAHYDRFQRLAVATEEIVK